MTLLRCSRVAAGFAFVCTASCGGGGGGGGGVPAGTLDPSFGGVGFLIGRLTGGIDGATDVAVQADGKIVVVGTTSILVEPDFFAARFEADGSPDVSFGFAGVRVVDFGGKDSCAAVAIQGDGKIVLAGYSDQGGGDDWAVARLNANGTTDTTFAGSGLFTFDPSSGKQDQAGDVIVQPDGKIVVAGAQAMGFGADFGVLRLDSLGVPDPAFGGTGYVTHDFGGEDVAVALRRDPADGSLVVAGRSDAVTTNDFAVCRFSSTGVFDATFGDRLVDFGWDDQATDVQIQADGKILVSGTDDGGSPDFAVARLDASGALDVGYNPLASPTTDNGNGRLSFTFGTPPYGGSEHCYRSVLLADGRLVLVGQTDAGPGVSKNFGLARVTSAGTLDAAFDGDGRATYDFASAPFEGGFAVAEDLGGRLVVVGVSGGGVAVFRVGG